jgi:hypothetical protein
MIEIEAVPLWSAAAFAVAMETPKIAFAPSLDLLSVPSNLNHQIIHVALI